jgi:hypothetical protein
MKSRRGSSGSQRRTRRGLGDGSAAVAFDRGLNLAPVDVKHAHGHGMRRPLQVSDKRDRASGVSSVGDQVKNDAGVAVEELDSVLHIRGNGQPLGGSVNLLMLWRSGHSRWLPAMRTREMGRVVVDVNPTCNLDAACNTDPAYAGGLVRSTPGIVPAVAVASVTPSASVRNCVRRAARCVAPAP